MQISQAIQQLASVVQQNSALSEELASSSEEVSAQASILLETISYFKITQREMSAQDEMEIEKQILKLTELLNLQRKQRATSPGKAIQAEPKKKAEKMEQYEAPLIKKGVQIDADDNTQHRYEKF